MSWITYLQSETPQEDMQYLENKVKVITERIRKGKLSVASEENVRKKTSYQTAVARLSKSRDFYTALLRFRDWELPNLLGGVMPDENDSGDKRCERVFQVICTMSHNLSCCTLTPEEESLRTQGINAATKKPVGQNLLKQMDAFGIDYDMFDAPVFYKDIVLTLNLISDFHDEVMNQIQATKKKAKK